MLVYGQSSVTEKPALLFLLPSITPASLCNMCHAISMLLTTPIAWETENMSDWPSPIPFWAHPISVSQGCSFPWLPPLRQGSDCLHVSPAFLMLCGRWVLTVHARCPVMCTVLQWCTQFFWSPVMCTGLLGTMFWFSFISFTFYILFLMNKILPHDLWGKNTCLFDCLFLREVWKWKACCMYQQSPGGTETVLSTEALRVITVHKSPFWRWLANPK